MKSVLKKFWPLGLGLALVASFIFSDSFRQTLVRGRAIRETQGELERLTRDAETQRDRLHRLEEDPNAYDLLVRKELGYLKPGEKEVRFLSSKGS